LCGAAALLTFGTAAADDRATCEDRKNEGAVAACSRLISQNPNDAAYYNKRGSAYSERGVPDNRKDDRDRAISDFDQAIRLDPKSAVAYSGRGYVYVSMRDLDRAISDFDQAVRLDPKSADAYNGLGLVYFFKGDYDCPRSTCSRRTSFWRDRDGQLLCYIERR
jgi:Flp pilus assembly protein TadD